MNKCAFVLLWVCGIVSGAACAEPSSRVAWTPETLALVKKADAGHGQELVKTLGCSACHGREAATAAPYLDGQSANYLFRQLHDYRDGSRADSTMSAMVGSLSEQDMANLAAGYAQQAPIAAVAPAAVDDNAAARRLVERGDHRRLITACAACHGDRGEGKPQDVPRLAGQKAAYLAATLTAYQAGRRHNDVYRRMRSLAEALTAEEIRQLADYYARQP